VFNVNNESNLFVGVHSRAQGVPQPPPPPPPPPPTPLPRPLPPPPPTSHHHALSRPGRYCSPRHGMYLQLKKRLMCSVGAASLLLFPCDHVSVLRVRRDARSSEGACVGSRRQSVGTRAQNCTILEINSYRTGKSGSSRAAGRRGRRTSSRRTTAARASADASTATSRYGGAD